MWCQAETWNSTHFRRYPRTSAHNAHPPHNPALSIWAQQFGRLFSVRMHSVSHPGRVLFAICTFTSTRCRGPAHGPARCCSAFVAHREAHTLSPTIIADARTFDGEMSAIPQNSATQQQRGSSSVKVHARTCVSTILGKMLCAQNVRLTACAPPPCRFA